MESVGKTYTAAISESASLDADFSA
jgi:hypothetical protein